MSAERPQPRPIDVYGFTDAERLYDRISDKRLRALLTDGETRVHKLEVSSNLYGEFLFISSSRKVDDTTCRVVFWGAGFHEYRERWITDEWYWYVSESRPDSDERTLTADTVRQTLQDRMDEIKPYISDEKPSRQAQLFALLADLTDEDGAYAELDDLGDLLDLFDDE